LNRLTFELAFIAVPSRAASGWIGESAAQRPATKTFTRALGARELGLAGGALGEPRAR
jgi:hypothetical protein